MSDRTILVIRATGTQGSALIRHLLKYGWKARAYVPNSADPRATALQAIGAELHQGTLDDEAVIARAISGCYGLFLAQMPSFADDSEVRKAKLILKAAKSAGVTHVVHSTSLGVGRDIDAKSLVAPAVLGKEAVEKLVREAGFKYWTILRPGYFMTNFLPPFAAYMFPELESEGKFVSSYKPDTLLPLIDPEDIGAVALAAFAKPTRFDQKTIPFAAEKKRVDDVVKELGKVMGRDFEAVYRSDEESAALAAANPFVACQIVTLDLHEVIDEEEVKALGIRFISFETFLLREKEKFQQLN